MVKIYLSAFILLFAGARAFACRGNETTPKISFEQAFGEARIAFIGTVIAVSKDSKNHQRAEFEVVKNLKGLAPKSSAFSLETGRSCDLGKYVEINSKWFILAHDVGELIQTNSYSRRLFQPSDEAMLDRQLKSTEVPAASRFLLDKNGNVLLNGAILKNETTDWFKCDRNADCVDVSYECAGNVVNRKFFRDADALYRNEALAQDCAPAQQKPHAIVCENHKCRKTEISPKSH